MKPAYIGYGILAYLNVKHLEGAISAYRNGLESGIETVNTILFMAVVITPALYFAGRFLIRVFTS